jgi:nucleotide-binding universal stress UspA family protein
MSEGDPSGVDVRALEGAVVVGDDGSASSARAVAWALSDASRRGVRLVVLRAWSIRSAPRPQDAEPGYVPGEDEFAQAVRDEVARDLREVLGEVTGSGEPDVLVLPVHLPPADALVLATRHATVTVVGARGSGLARWLGSVSAALVRAAVGPVVVVPDRSGSAE